MIVVEILVVFAQLALGWLLADFLSGLLHWLEDRFGPGREHWPILGKLIFRPNLMHHADPLLFVQSGFWDRNWTTWAVVGPLAALLFWFFGIQPWIVAAAIGGTFANEIHAWAHRKSFAPEWAQWLQRYGVIQSPRHHAVHHVPDYRRHYCILTDWMNPVLECIDFWGRIERMLPERWFT